MLQGGGGGSLINWIKMQPSHAISVDSVEIVVFDFPEITDNNINIIGGALDT